MSSPESQRSGYGTLSSDDTQRSHDTASLFSDDGSINVSKRQAAKDPKPLLDATRRKSNVDGDEPFQVEPPTMQKKPETVTWSSLPRKSQLAILTFARLSEPLVQTSLRSYMYYQLKSFDHSLPDSVIASQAGIMQGSFAAAQLCTTMLWGRWSDHGGRKRVLLLGLSGTAISCVGFGLSRNFYQAMAFRMLGGALNGNVGVMRTMISEIVREKKYQSRAFLLLPMMTNIGIVIGPMIGGLTADPAASYPSLFGGISFFEKFPYATPNLISAFLLSFAACAVFFGLEETHEQYADKDDMGVKLRKKVSSIFSRKISSGSYSSISSDPTNGHVAEYSTPAPKPRKKVVPRYTSKLPFEKIFTYNVLCTLFCHALMAFCMSTFNNIWYSFLSTPVYDPAKAPPGYHPHLPFVFTGGIGLPPRSVGLAMAIIGTMGITLQLFLYPIINARLGTVRSWRIFLYCFPVVYLLVPFLSIIPSTTPPPSQKTGLALWGSLTAVLFIQVIGRTFASPATTILINNCSPHPSVLGTIHGIGQTASSASKTFGPAIGGWLYGLGLKNGIVGATFWGLSLFALGSIISSNWVREGDGHEIWLEGDKEAEEEAERENRWLLAPNSSAA